MPRTQVYMMRHNPAAMLIGTQPPSNNFRIFAEKNTCSINRNGIISAAARQIGHFQHFHTTKNAIKLSMTIAAVTDTP